MIFGFHRRQVIANIKRNVAKKQFNSKAELQEHFKIYNIEYEKAKYLDNTEIKKMLDKAKKQEGRDLDEISVMLYANKNS